ncbi:MAG: hypothetical protein ACETVT_00845, partial [bacterium]
MSVSKNSFGCYLVFSLALIIPLCIPTLARARIYYVAEDGKDSNPGTETQPWASVDKAAEEMVAGDTVYIKQGTYSGFQVSRS